MAHFVLFLWLLVAGLLPSSCGQQTPDEENHSALVTKSVSSTFLNDRQFALNLYRQLMTPDSGRNLLFSPLSFSLPLTLLALQANPEAHTQILKNLGFPLADIWNTEAYTYYSQFLEIPLRWTWQCEIYKGSVLFLGQKQDPVNKFVQLAQNLCYTEVIPISFRNSRVAKHQMDFITQQKTHGKITTLLQKVQPHFILVLANYIFFKGTWKHRFDPKLTKIRPFSVSKKIVIPVSMMKRLGWFQVRYLYHLYSFVLRLPCTCNITTIFILPEEGMIKKAEEALMKGNFGKRIRPFPLSRRKLYLPRISLSGDIKLEQLMLTPGGSDLFSYNASLSGISLQNRPMKVNKAFHRAELTLDEEGSEEEDITHLNSLPKYLVPILEFNRPFLMLIFKEDSHNLLFLGKVTNPNINL